jgi:hypothetical protein
LAGIVGSVCCRIFAIISDTPPQDRAAVSKTNLEPHLFCTMLRQKLGGKIRKLILSVKMKNFQHAFLNHIMDKMQVNLKVFHARMLPWIETKFISTQVVTE